MPTPLNQKPATAAWIVRERKRLKLKPRDLVERLAAQGLVVSEATVKVWESNANRRPAPENLEGLERVFESSAPVNAAMTGDQSSLAAALLALTEELAAVRLERAAWERGVLDVLRAYRGAPVPTELLDALAPQPLEPSQP